MTELNQDINKAKVPETPIIENLIAGTTRLNLAPEGISELVAAIAADKEYERLKELGYRNREEMIDYLKIKSNRFNRFTYRNTPQKSEPAKKWVHPFNRQRILFSKDYAEELKSIIEIKLKLLKDGALEEADRQYERFKSLGYETYQEASVRTGVTVKTLKSKSEKIVSDKLYKLEGLDDEVVIKYAHPLVKTHNPNLLHKSFADNIKKEKSVPEGFITLRQFAKLTGRLVTSERRFLKGVYKELKMDEQVIKYETPINRREIIFHKSFTIKESLAEALALKIKQFTEIDREKILSSNDMSILTGRNISDESGLIERIVKHFAENKEANEINCFGIPILRTSMLQFAFSGRLTWGYEKSIGGRLAEVIKLRQLERAGFISNIELSEISGIHYQSFTKLLELGKTRFDEDEDLAETRILTVDIKRGEIKPGLSKGNATLFIAESPGTQLALAAKRLFERKKQFSSSAKLSELTGRDPITERKFLYKIKKLFDDDNSLESTVILTVEIKRGEIEEFESKGRVLIYIAKHIEAKLADAIKRSLVKQGASEKIGDAEKVPENITEKLKDIKTKEAGRED